MLPRYRSSGLKTDSGESAWGGDLGHVLPLYKVRSMREATIRNIYCYTMKKATRGGGGLCDSDKSLKRVEIVN